MMRSVIKNSFVETTRQLLSRRVNNLPPYHVKMKVTFFQRIQQISYSRVLGLQQSLMANQNVTTISMDEPFMKKYLSDILQANANDNYQKPHYWGALNELITQRQLLLANINSLNELKQGEENDGELKALAEEEQSKYQDDLISLDNEILKTIIPQNVNETCSDIMVEISSGAGGQESMLFAYELLQMYENYAFLRGWTFHIDSIDKTDLGGIRNTSIFIQGDGAFYYMQNEIGVHRVQRVPVTSTAGMIHTSTAAVVVMPQPSDVDIKIEDKDVVVETMRASGPGGQNVNKVESAVRVRHLPSGIIVECQENQCQHRNREVALRKLRTKLFNLETQKQNKEITANRLSQLGNRERSAKIRTYNFPQNRVTDHRGHLTTHNIKDFMLGGNAFHNFLEKLNEENEKQLILQFVSDIRAKALI